MDRPSTARAVVVVLVTGLLAFQVVRTAAVRNSPQLAAALWPGHPELMTDRTMARIGALSARGEALPRALLGQVSEIARKAPLAPEPFLIHGAMAQLKRRDQAAERLYLEARARDPRSRAARYFLADRYLRTGRIAPALGELAVLSRLTAEAGVFAPALATFAQTPGAVGQLRRFFRSAPEFEPIVLANLATEAKNLDLILALWSGESKQLGTADWQSAIVAKLVENGDFARAHAVWRRLFGVRHAPPGLFNPGFRKLSAPPPFNWSFGSAGGLANPTPGGQLEVIYFGREDALLAEQLMLLAPGRYRLGVEVTGDLQDAGEIAWTVECLPGNQRVMRLPLRNNRRSARLQAIFAIPPGCPAQRLQLTGSLGEFPRAIEFGLGKMELSKVGRR